jgi:hypothetical protein
MMSKFSVDAFQEACQAREPLGLDVIGSGMWQSKRIRLDQPFAVVGSHDQAHVRWQDAQLSPHHAYFQVIAGCVFGIDLETRSGTHWPRARRGCGWVGPDDPLALASRRVRITQPSGTPDTSWNPLAPQSLERGGAPNLRVEIRLDHGPTTFWTANRVLFLIGKSRLCKIRLHRPEISPFHASVISTPKGAWVVDLASSSGILVNGNRTQVARLEPDDELRLGPFAIHIQPTGPA